MVDRLGELKAIGAVVRGVDDEARQRRPKL
jgi:hypothetical protein